MGLGIIIQARMTSTRLPGKVLKPLNLKTGETILESTVTRAKLTKGIDKVIVACTEESSDDAIETLGDKIGVPVFRGSENNVLDRYYQATVKYEFDPIIRITSDCPFIDPSVIFELIEFFKSGDYDYASNAINRTWPHGLDCEIFKFSALEKAVINSKTKEDLEHVTYHMYNNPESFSIGGITLPKGEDHSKVRITVDTKEDYLLACALRDLLPERDDYSWRDIISVFENRPWLELINSKVAQKKKFIDKKEELIAAVNYLDLQEMPNAADIIRKELE